MMSCLGSTQCRHAKVVAQERRLFGTWDFKWRQGTKIRVAFLDSTKELNQPLQLEGQTLTRRRAVEELANRWLAELDGERGVPNISFEFIDEFDRTAATEVFEAQMAAREQAAKEGRRVEDDAKENNLLPAARDTYDVLLWLGELPEESYRPAQAEESILASSHLGSYARRERRYIPTAYLGVSKDRDLSPKAYFDSPEFAWTVIHEFGHILGLAHEHQNPLVDLRWKELPEAMDLFRKVLHPKTSDKVLAEYLQSELTSKWPSSPVSDGSVPFSDWQPGSAQDVLGSVMTFPLARFLVAGSPTPAAVGPDLLAQAVGELGNRPSVRDLRHLRALYPPVK
jgi:hypothetical protein